MPTAHFSVQLPFSLTNGQISLYVEVVDLAGNTSPPSNTLTVTIVSVASDYNGDGYSDPALYSRNTTTNQGQWLVQATTPPAGASSSNLVHERSRLRPGQRCSIPGRLRRRRQDRPGVLPAQHCNLEGGRFACVGISSFTLGTPNSSIPVVGYFDANGPDEMAVFTIVNGQGVWSIASAISPRTVTFGQTGDIPEPGNYDGLGYDQIAVYRPSTGQFLVLEPNGTTETLNLGVGGSADLSSLVPVPGAYDNQAYFTSNQPQRTEAAVYDPIAGVFTILGPGSSTYTVSGFLPGDIPAPADYLGNGSTQPVVFRPSTGQFIGAGGAIIATFGQSGDIPLAAPLSYRMPSSDPPIDRDRYTGTGTTGTGYDRDRQHGTGTTGTGINGNWDNRDWHNRDWLRHWHRFISSLGLRTSTPPPAQSPGSGLPHPGTSTHKKTVAKHKPKPVVHHKKPVVHKKVKVVQNHAAKPKVHVVTHKVTKVVTASASVYGQSQIFNASGRFGPGRYSRTNLRRSSSEKTPWLIREHCRRQSS